MSEYPLTEPATPKKKRIGLYILVVALIVAGGGYWFYKHRHNTKTGSSSYQGGSGRPGGPSNGSNDPQPVQAAVVVKGDQPVYFSGLGTVTAAGTVTVKTQVNGVLQKLHFVEGETIKAGQLLAEIDPRPFQVQLEQAQGQLAKDQALLAQARQDLERYKTLLTQDSIAQQQVDAQVSLVRQQEGAIKVDQAQVDSAKLQLTYSRITAPITGQAGLRQVDMGNLVQTSDANGLVVLTQVDPIYVLFTLPEVQLQRVVKPMRAGETLVAEAWDRSMGHKLATGKLLTMDNQIDPTTGTIKLRAEFANPERTLYPNQFVNIRLKVATDQNVLIAPMSAIQKGSQGNFVWVVGATKSADKTDSSAPVAQSDAATDAHYDEKKGDWKNGKPDGKPDTQKGEQVSLRLVKIGPVDGDRVVILEGVQEGERLVTDGADRLRDSASVEVVDSNKILDDAASAAAAQKKNGRHKRGPQ